MTTVCQAERDCFHYAGVWLNRKQRQAFRYLEKHGLRFLVDFGYGNCIDKARETRRQFAAHKK